MTNIWSSTLGFVWVSDEQVFYAGASGSGPMSSVDKADCVTVVNLKDQNCRVDLKTPRHNHT